MNGVGWGWMVADDGRVSDAAPTEDGAGWGSHERGSGDCRGGLAAVGFAVRRGPLKDSGPNHHERLLPPPLAWDRLITAGIGTAQRYIGRLRAEEGGSRTAPTGDGRATNREVSLGWVGSRSGRSETGRYTRTDADGGGCLGGLGAGGSVVRLGPVRQAQGRGSPTDSGPALRQAQGRLSEDAGMTVWLLKVGAWFDTRRRKWRPGSSRMGWGPFDRLAADGVRGSLAARGSRVSRVPLETLPLGTHKGYPYSGQAHHECGVNSGPGGGAVMLDQRMREG